MFLGDKSTSEAIVDDSASNKNDTMAMQQLEVDLSPSAIAGLMEPEAERFEDHRDPRLKCSPLSHTWTPSGDVLVGCQLGQLLRVGVL